MSDKRVTDDPAIKAIVDRLCRGESLTDADEEAFAKALYEESKDVALALFANKAPTESEDESADEEPQPPRRPGDRWTLKWSIRANVAHSIFALPMTKGRRRTSSAAFAKISGHLLLALDHFARTGEAPSGTIVYPFRRTGDAPAKMCLFVHGCLLVLIVEGDMLNVDRFFFLG
jgi:hypothetical protein